VVVHHLNEDPTDDALENLCLMRSGEHAGFHFRGDRNPNRKKYLAKLAAEPQMRFSFTI
jgi:hypothetical protein